MPNTLKTLLIAAVALIAVACIWFIFLYHPKTTKLETLKAKTDDLMLKLQSFRVKDEQITTLEKQAEQIKTEIENRTDRVASKEALPNVVKTIKKQGRMHGLKFEQIIPDYQALIPIQEENAEVKEVMKVTLHIQVQGYYKSFGRFVETLDELPYLISVGDIGVAYTKELHPKLTITMDAILYFRSKESKT